MINFVIYVYIRQIKPAVESERESSQYSNNLGPSGIFSSLSEFFFQLDTRKSFAAWRRKFTEFNLAPEIRRWVVN